MNSKLILLLFALAFFNSVFSQRYNECNPSGEAHVSADSVARFPGSLQDYFFDNLNSKIGNFSGIIIVNIFIDKSGSPCCFFYSR